MRRVPRSSSMQKAIALSTEVYFKVNSSGSIKSLILDPCGADS